MKEQGWGKTRKLHLFSLFAAQLGCLLFPDKDSNSLRLRCPWWFHPSANLFKNTKSHKRNANTLRFISEPRERLCHFKSRRRHCHPSRAPYREKGFSLLTPRLSSLYSYRIHYVTAVLPLPFELLSLSCHMLLKMRPGVLLEACLVLHRHETTLLFAFICSIHSRHLRKNKMTDDLSDLLLLLFGRVPVFWVDYRKIGSRRVSGRAWIGQMTAGLIGEQVRAMKARWQGQERKGLLEGGWRRFQKSEDIWWVEGE